MVFFVGVWIWGLGGGGAGAGAFVVCEAFPQRWRY